MNDSISTRCAKLNQIFAGKTVGRKSSPNGAGFTREALLDAFLLLFEECSSEFMLKDKNISGFVKKCKYKELYWSQKSLYFYHMHGSRQGSSRSVDYKFGLLIDFASLTRSRCQ